MPKLAPSRQPLCGLDLTVEEAGANVIWHTHVLAEFPAAAGRGRGRPS